MKTPKFLTAAALMAFATPAASQVQVTPNFDADADSLIRADEFNAGFGEMGTYARFDGDADGVLNADEFDALSQREELRGDRAFGSFAEYDLDADGTMSEDEYNAAWFGRYDADRSGDIDALESRGLVEDMGAPGLFDEQSDFD